jgi:hypothetical protein
MAPGSYHSDGINFPQLAWRCVESLLTLRLVVYLLHVLADVLLVHKRNFVAIDFAA